MLVYLASYPRSGNRWSQDVIRHSFGYPHVELYSIYWPHGLDEIYARFGPDLERPDGAPGRDVVTPELRRRIAASDDVVILKTHELPPSTFFKGEKVIHVVRHPGAALWSYLHFLRDKEHVIASKEDLILGVYSPGSWSRHTNAWSDAGRKLGADYLRYSYEEMHHEMEKVRDAIGRLLCLASRADVESMSSFDEMHARWPLLVRSGNIDEWKTNFTAAEIKLLIRMHGPTMKKAGYDVKPAPLQSETTLVQTAGIQAHAGLTNQKSITSPGLLKRLLGARYRRYELYKYQLQRFILQMHWTTRSAFGMERDAPVVLHITNHKAGSQWVAEILKHCVAGTRYVPALSNCKHFTSANLRPGAVLPALYLSREQVEAVTAGYRGPIRRLVVIRDLRDILVSLYFSLRYSHVVTPDSPELKTRDTLMTLSIDEALRWLMKEYLGDIARSQSSWISADDRLLVRYEDILADENGQFDHILSYCMIKTRAEVRRSVIRDNSFISRSGRASGQENIMSHQRKGIAGDWRSHFTDSLKAEFKLLYGDVLIAAGYETGLDW